MTKKLAFHFMEKMLKKYLCQFWSEFWYSKMLQTLEESFGSMMNRSLVRFSAFSKHSLHLPSFRQIEGSISPKKKGSQKSEFRQAFWIQLSTTKVWNDVLFWQEIFSSFLAKNAQFFSGGLRPPEPPVNFQITVHKVLIKKWIQNLNTFPVSLKPQIWYMP